MNLKIDNLLSGTLDVHTVFSSKNQLTGGPLYYEEKKEISFLLIYMVYSGYM